jgi:hypothetical protein
MPRHTERTRTLAQALARHLVRVTAVAALAASGAAAAAEELRPAESRDDDDDDLKSLDGALRRATEKVLSSPPEGEDRALMILLAAREAVALAAVDEPEPRHTAALLENAGIVEHLAAEADTLLWHVDDDPPPRR